MNETIMSITIIVMVLVILAYTAYTVYLRDRVDSLTTSNKWRDQRLLEKTNALADAISEKNRLQYQITSLMANTLGLDRQINTLTDNDLKRILQYVHPDRTGKDTRDLFVKLNEIRGNRNERN